MPKVYTYMRPTPFLDLDTQRQQCRDYLDRLREKHDGLIVGKVFMDAQDAATRELPERPGGRALALAVDRGDMVITAALSVMFKDERDFRICMDCWAPRAIQLHALDYPVRDCGINEKLLESLGRFKDERRCEIAQAATAKRRAAGQCVGPARLGTRHVGLKGNRRVVPDVHEQRVMRLLVELVDVKRMTWDRAYFELLRRRVLRPSGYEYSRGACQRLYRGAKAIGMGAPIL